MKNEYMEEAPEVIRDFLGYIQNVQGKSAMTINVYYVDLRIFFRYIKRHKGLADESVPYEKIPIDDVNVELIKTITFSDMKSFMNYCLEERGNQEAARARKCSVLNTFFRYLTKKAGVLDNNPAESLDFPKKKKALPKYLTLEQSIELLNAVEGEFRERDYCILILFLNCGMRLSELVGINVNDVRSDNTLRLLGKGNKERIVYLNDACMEAVNAYRKVRPTEGLEDKNALFISRRKKRISKQTVQMMVYKYIKKIGLESQGYSVHKLRHTAATLMYQHGNVDIRVLKDILGHENLGTTEIYTHLSSQQVQSAMNSNPLAKVKHKD